MDQNSQASDIFSEFSEEEFPLITEALVSRMELLYPDRCPEMTDPDRMIWIKSGQRSVVTFLRARLIEQETLRSRI